MPDDLRPEEGVETGEDRTLRLARQERKLLLPVIHDFGVLDGPEKPLPVTGLDQEPPYVRERPSLAAFKECQDRIAEDGRHLVAETGGQALENRDEVRRQEIPFEIGMGREDIEPDGVGIVRRIEEHDVMDAFLGNPVHHLVDQIPVGVEDAEAFAV